MNINTVVYGTLILLIMILVSTLYSSVQDVTKINQFCQENGFEGVKREAKELICFRITEENIEFAKIEYTTNTLSMLTFGSYVEKIYFKKPMKEVFE